MEDVCHALTENLAGPVSYLPHIGVRKMREQVRGDREGNRQRDENIKSKAKTSTVGYHRKKRE